MFTVKPLARKRDIKFHIKPLVKKPLTPAQERASYITMLTEQGKSYGEAIRAYDSRVKSNV